MIQGFEDYTHELTKEEISLALVMKIAFMNHHNNVSNTVAASRIVAWAKARFNIKITGPRIRKIIHYLRVTHEMPIVGTNSGYYQATNREEVRKYLVGLKQRIDSQVEIYEIMQIISNK